MRKCKDVRHLRLRSNILEINNNRMIVIEVVDEHWQLMASNTVPSYFKYVFYLSNIVQKR